CPTVVLPQPDSPTSPTVSPACIAKLTPSTAWTVECLSAISTRRSATSSTGCGVLIAPPGGTSRFPRIPLPWSASRTGAAHHSPPAEPDLERVAERVADEVEAHDREHDR